jgi:4-oxalocrotonate tautomerase
MPMVNVKITREGATAEQKSQVIAEMTEVLARVLGKNPATTIVIIEEVETENWGIAGEPVSERRKRGV